MTSIPAAFKPPVSESVSQSSLIERRPDAIVFVTEEPYDAAMLRSRGLVAVSRPDGGLWDSASLAPLRWRVVAVLNTEPYGGSDWHERDARAIAAVAALVRVVVPLAFTRPDDRHSGLAEVFLPLGPDLFVAETRSTLVYEGADVELVDFLIDPAMPRQLKPELPTVPSLRPEMIPEPLRAWLVDIAERVGCPLEYVAVTAIIVAASLVGRKIGIRPKRCDNWLVVANLWGVVIGRPGLMKTPSLAEVLMFLHQLSAEARERHAVATETHAAGAMVGAAKAKAAKESLERGAKHTTGSSSLPDGELMKLATQAVAGRENPPPTLRRYTVSDCTVEKLGEILSENPNGVLLYRDELSGFFRTLDKPGREGDRQAYLEFWNGDGRIVYDRIGRGTIHIDGACLSLIGGIQPGPLASYVRQAASANGADGLIARFQLMVWPDEPGPWRNVDRRPNGQARSRALEVFQKLDSLDPDSIGATREEGESLPFLRFDSEAQELFDEWRHSLENDKLRNSHENPLIEEHLSKYRSLMPSLALLFHLIDIVDRGGREPVPRGSTELAAAWCDVLECHARRVYAVAFDADPFAARRLADRIKAGDVPSPFRVRDVVRHGWSGLDETRDVEKAVNVLEDHGWVYGVDKPSGPRGGHPTVEYYVNRRVRGGGS